jgi:hypothetical protein
MDLSTTRVLSLPFLPYQDVDVLRSNSLLTWQPTTKEKRLGVCPSCPELRRRQTRDMVQRRDASDDLLLPNVIVARIIADIPE